MKSTTILALAVLTVGTLKAQTSASAPPPVGVLGQQYAELNFGFDDIKHTDHDANSFSLTGNRAIMPNVDGRLTYSYAWLDHAPHVHDNTLAASAVTFMKLDSMRPFAAATLGWSWDSLPFGASDDYGIWGLAVGAEIPLGNFAITPRIDYNDDFESSARSGQEFSYGVEGNYWLNRSTAVYARVAWVDVRQSDFDRWSYNLGVRLKF